jgi:hypothetical protein
MSESGPPLRLSFGVTGLSDDVFAFFVSELTQSLAEGVEFRRSAGWRAGAKDSDPIDFRRLLRFGGKAKRKEHSAQGKTTEYSTYRTRQAICQP